jgi:hypothetical protein
MAFDRRAFLVAALACAGGCASAPRPPDFSGDPLMRSLTAGGGGLSKTQAAGGLGAFVSLARTRLGPDYAALARLLPFADTYVQVAADAGLLARPIVDVAALNAAFQTLGIDGLQAKGLLDTTVAYAKRQGGDAGRELVARTLAV